MKSKAARSTEVSTCAHKAQDNANVLSLTILWDGTNTSHISTDVCFLHNLIQHVTWHAWIFFFNFSQESPLNSTNESKTQSMKLLGLALKPKWHHVVAHLFSVASEKQWMKTKHRAATSTGPFLQSSQADMQWEIMQKAPTNHLVDAWMLLLTNAKVYLIAVLITCYFWVCSLLLRGTSTHLQCTMLRQQKN